jgi:hypothetical protein
MNANRIGKTLVLVHTAASLLFMTFAGAVFFQQIDWGWKEPRKDMSGTVRFASEIDQRSAAVVEAQKTIAMVGAPLGTAQALLASAEPRLYQNHLWYRDQLANLQSDPALKSVKEIKLDKGAVVLDAPEIGKPVLGQDLPGLVHCHEQYLKELKDLQATIDDITNKIQKVVEEEEKPLTYLLNGKDDAGKPFRPGLYQLVDDSYQEQVRTKFEIDYLRPQWVELTRQLGQFQERYSYLEENLGRLKKGRPGFKK